MTGVWHTSPAFPKMVRTLPSIIERKLTAVAGVKIKEVRALDRWIEGTEPYKNADERPRSDGCEAADCPRDPWLGTGLTVIESEMVNASLFSCFKMVTFWDIFLLAERSPFA